MKNIKISVRLTILLSFCVICVLALSVYFFSAINRITDQFEIFADSCMPAAASADNINNYLENYRISEYNYVIIDNADEKKEASKLINEYYNLVQQEISNVEKYDMTSSEREYINSFKNSWNNYIKQSQKAMDLSAERKNAEASRILTEDSEQEYTAAKDAVGKLISSKEKTAREAQEKAHEIHTGSTGTSVVIVVVFIVIIFAASFVIMRSINFSIKNLRSAVKNISEGGMDVKIDIDGKDELSELSRDFNKTVLRLNEYIKYINEITVILDGIANGNLNYELKQEYTGEFGKIKNSFENLSEVLNGAMGSITQSSNQVSDGAEQVSGSMQEFARGTMEQADFVENLVLSIDNISNTVSLSAENIKEAGQLANSFGKIIEQSNKRMEDMTKSMEEITDTSGEISKIIKLIDDIAFQTNILSLNAAVEAARAGTAGKGFAVVADEVRNLATKSAEAAKNTAELIKNSIKAVDNGTKIADDTAEILNSAVEETQKLIDTMSSISKAGESQLEAVEQIRGSVEQISNIVQNNSAIVEESVSVSTQLSNQAENLKDLVGKFNFKKEYMDYDDNDNGYADFKSSDVPEIRLEPTESFNAIPADNNMDFSMNYGAVDNSAFSMDYSGTDSGFDMNYDDNSSGFDASYENNDFDAQNEMYDDPPQIVLTENAEDAYVPEINLVKNYNDNGSDKY